MLGTFGPKTERLEDLHSTPYYASRFGLVSVPSLSALDLDFISLTMRQEESANMDRKLVNAWEGA